MGTKYKRIEDLEEKIHTVKLPYEAWKVFFLIDGEVGTTQIAEFLDEDQHIVETALKRLEKENLVKLVEGEEVRPPLEMESEMGLAESAEEKAAELDKASEQAFDSEGFEFKDAFAEKPLEEEFQESLVEPSEPGLKDESIEMEKGQPELSEELISSAEEEFRGIDSLTEEEDIPELLTDDLNLSELEVEEEAIETEQTIDLNAEDLQESIKDVDVADLDIDFTEVARGEEIKSKEFPIQKIAEKEKVKGTKAILVIDDSIVIRKMVEIALEDENFTLHTAVSGKDGLALIDEKNPDLIILDLMLPDINGIDLLKTVKASKGIPVIMLSGKDSPQMVEKARAEGADAFLPKPFKDEELVDKIKELLA